MVREVFSAVKYAEGSVKSRSRSCSVVDVVSILIHIVHFDLLCLVQYDRMAVEMVSRRIAFCCIR